MPRVLYRAEVDIYEIGGEEQHGAKPLVVSTNQVADRVNLQIDHGVKFTVLASDLIEAVQRCSGGR
jgi:hypothetical protein